MQVINPLTPAPTSPIEPANDQTAARAVTLTHGACADGRLPVVVTVVPVADFAAGGVFIEFRQGPKVATAPTKPVQAAGRAQGDAAIDALAAAETLAARPRNPVVQHQIGKACQLTLGQADSFRAEVAMPLGPTELGAWYVRARLPTSSGGRDLVSTWQKV